jgi:hypothetical protein
MIGGVPDVPVVGCTDRGRRRRFAFGANNGARGDSRGACHCRYWRRCDHGLDNRQFERELTIGTDAQLVIQFAEQFDPTHQGAEISAVRLTLDLRCFFFGNIKERTIGASAEQHHGAQPLDQIAGKLTQVGARSGDIGDHLQRARQITGDQCVRQRRHFLHFAGAKQVPHLFERYGSATVCHQLVEHAERIAHTAGSGAGNRFGDARFQGDAFLSRDRPQVRRNRGNGMAVEDETLTARQDRRRHLVNFGRRQDKERVRRRLFERLQQRIERRRREHMHFVDDVDLGARNCRAELHALDDLARIFDACMRCSVHFDHVNGTSFGDGATRLAYAARTFRQRRGAVDGLRQQASNGRLADAARTGEQVGMRDPALRNRVPQRADDVFLPDQLIERL